MRVAIDEPGHGATSPSVELFDLAVERTQLPHLPDLGDRTVVDEHVGVLEDVDAAELGCPQRRPAAGRRRDLREVADEQARHSGGSMGTLSPPARAASIASG